MLAGVRRDRILTLLQDRRSASVGELSELLQVSEVTVRQDLNLLAEEGRLVRTRGGALLPSRTSRELTFASRAAMNTAQKQRIGERAASLVASGDSILLDASSTAVYVARALRQRRDLSDLTLITNGIHTALEVVERPEITTVLTGGIVRMTADSLNGAIAEDMLSKIHATRGFFGTRGLTLEQGLTEVNLQEAQVKRAMLRRCQEVVVVADASKFGEVSLTSFAALDQVDRIITDTAAPQELLEALQARGVRVDIV